MGDTEMIVNNLQTGQRGQVAVVAAVLLVALVIGAAGFYQVAVVPTEVEAAEQAHDEQVRQQLRTVADSLDTVSTGSAASKQPTISLGTGYSTGPFVTPPTVEGELESIDTTPNVTVSEAIDSSGNTYWDGSTREFETAVIRYKADYNNYQNAPTYYVENGGVIAKHDGGSVSVVQEPDVIDGTTVDLRLTQGNRSARGSDREPLNIAGATQSPVQVRVKAPDRFTPIVIRFPTAGSEAVWNDILEDELVGNGGNVEDLTVDESSGLNTVKLRLDPRKAYDLRIPRAYLGQSIPAQKVSYILLDKDQFSLAPGGAQSFSPTPHDKYGYPVAGVSIDASTSGGGTFDQATRVAGGDGEASFTFRLPKSATSGVTETITFGLSDSSLAETSLGTVSSTGAISVASDGGEVSVPAEASWAVSQIGSQPGVACNPSTNTCTVDLDTTQNVQLTAKHLGSNADGVRMDFQSNGSKTALRPTYQFTENGQASATLKIWETGTYKLSTRVGGKGEDLTIATRGSPGPVVTELSITGEIGQEPDSQDYTESVFQFGVRGPNREDVSGRFTVKARPCGASKSVTTTPRSTKGARAFLSIYPWRSGCSNVNSYTYTGTANGNVKVELTRSTSNNGEAGNILLIGKKPPECSKIDDSSLQVTDGGGRINVC